MVHSCYGPIHNILWIFEINLEFSGKKPAAFNKTAAEIPTKLSTDKPQIS